LLNPDGWGVEEGEQRLSRGESHYLDTEVD
jgi:hypothetical protein